MAAIMHVKVNIHQTVVTMSHVAVEGWRQNAAHQASSGMILLDVVFLWGVQKPVVVVGLQLPAHQHAQQRIVVNALNAQLQSPGPQGLTHVLACV